MNALLLALLAALGAPARAAAAGDPYAEAAALLEKSVGPDAARILDERGYLALHGRGKSGRLLHAQWAALETLAANARGLSAFVSLYDALRAGKAAETQAPLDRLRELPASGLLTGPVRAAMDVAARHLDNEDALGNTRPPAGGVLLYRTPWGRRFAERHRVELASDVRPLAPLYYERYLGGADAPEGAEAHFLRHLEAVYQKKGGADLLARSRAAGTASPEALGWVAKYLLDQRRFLAAARTRERLQALEKAGLSKDVKDLRAVATALAKAEGLPARLREALERSPRRTASFSGGDRLHAHGPQGRPFDPGDELEITYAYWVDGLGPGRKVEVFELGWLDQGQRGMAARALNAVERGDGGPYVFKARVPVSSSDPAVYRLALRSPDAPELSEEAALEVSPRLEERLRSAARAEHLASECRPSEAAATFSELARELVPLARKDQFKRLAAWAEKRAAEAAKEEALRKRLLHLLPGARLYASAEQCEYKPERAAEALSVLKQLPAGCDRLDPEEGKPALSVRLEEAYRTTERRRLVQQAFLEAAGRARRLEEQCKPEEAARLYAGALALLDAEPAARCGEPGRRHSEIRLRELPRARAAKAALQSMESIHRQAAARFSAKDFAGALGVLNPLLARVDSLPESERSCYKPLRGKALGLSEAAGISLAAPDRDRAAAALPKDQSEEAVRAVVARKRRLSQEKALQRAEEDPR